MASEGGKISGRCPVLELWTLCALLDFLRLTGWPGILENDGTTSLRFLEAKKFMDGKFMEVWLVNR